MRPKMSLLVEEDIKRIVRGAMELLEETGIVVHNKNALDIFARGGAKVDYPAELVPYSVPYGSKKLWSLLRNI